MARPAEPAESLQFFDPVKVALRTWRVERTEPTARPQPEQRREQLRINVAAAREAPLNDQQRTALEARMSDTVATKP